MNLGINHRTFSPIPAIINGTPRPFCSNARNTPSTIKMVGGFLAIIFANMFSIFPPILIALIVKLSYFFHLSSNRETKTLLIEKLV